MLEYLMDIAVMLTAVVSTIIAVVVINRNPEVVDVELFGPVEKEEDSQDVLPYPATAYERVFERTKDGKKCLQLMLKNIGQPLVFEGIRVGQKSELIPQYLPLELKAPQESIDIQDEYPSGTSLTVFLFFKEEEKDYYDFLLKFQDLEGNYFRQRISGLGQESPIIDAAKKLSKQPEA